MCSSDLLSLFSWFQGRTQFQPQPQKQNQFSATFQPQIFGTTPDFATKTTPSSATSQENLNLQTNLNIPKQITDTSQDQFQQQQFQQDQQYYTPPPPITEERQITFPIRTPTPTSKSTDITIPPLFKPKSTPDIFQQKRASLKPKSLGHKRTFRISTFKPSKGEI